MLYLKILVIIFFWKKRNFDFKRHYLRKKMGPPLIIQIWRDTFEMIFEFDQAHVWIKQSRIFPIFFQQQQKMDKKKSIFIAVIAAVVAVAMVEVDPKRWEAKESAKLAISKEDLFKFITDSKMAPEVRHLL